MEGRGAEGCWDDRWKLGVMCYTSRFEVHVCESGGRSISSPAVAELLVHSDLVVSAKSQPRRSRMSPAAVDLEVDAQIVWELVLK